MKEQQKSILAGQLPKGEVKLELHDIDHLEREFARNSTDSTPAVLLALADRVEGYDAAACVAGATALRSYAELVAALEWLDAQPHTGLEYSGHWSPCKADDAVWLAKKLGWKGLEETGE